MKRQANLRHLPEKPWSVTVSPIVHIFFVWHWASSTCVCVCVCVWLISSFTMNPPEKEQCMERFFGSKSEVPLRPSTRRWYKQIKKTGTGVLKGVVGHPNASDKNIQSIRWLCCLLTVCINLTGRCSVFEDRVPWLVRPILCTLLTSFWLGRKRKPLCAVCTISSSRWHLCCTLPLPFPCLFLHDS